MNTVVLEKTCLDSYISKSIEISEADKIINLLQAKAGEIDEFIKEREQDVKSFEMLSLGIVRKNKNDCLIKIKQTETHKTYPEIDLSFLSMSNKVKGFFLPKFTVYRYEGDNKFEVHINISRSEKNFVQQFPDIIKAFFKKTFKEEKIIMGIKNIVKIIPPFILPPIVVGFLTFCVGGDITIIIALSFVIGGFLGIAIGFCNYENMDNIGCIFSTEFNGLIPLEVKNKIEKAKIVFGNEVYIIAETKPEEWKKSIIKVDPIVVGIIEDKCYLIDHFNCTTMEDYVRKEFTS